MEESRPGAKPDTMLRKILQPPWRTLVFGLLILLFVFAASVLWRPGLDLRDGRHDRRSNGIWLSHGWLGADEWFQKHGKTNQLVQFRNRENIERLAARLREHHITDLYPHLCPAEPDGSLPPHDPRQTEAFLDVTRGLRVIPWVGGPNGSSARPHKPAWRTTFARSLRQLLLQHPRLAGVQINVEPLTSGDDNLLRLLEEIRKEIPEGRLLSVAAYPPPTRWQPSPEIHWDEAYFREVARRSDQMAVMMYDVGQRSSKAYQRLMAAWTAEVLAWSEGKPVLLGVPTYDDAGSGYHDPAVENLRSALLGIHRGLSRETLPAHYQGISLYCEWETDDAEWASLKERFLAR